MRVAITGSSGLIGSAVARALEANGDSVTRLKRGRDYDIERRTVEPASLEGHDALVHLAGESVAGLWTAAKKRRIRDSRIDSTTLLTDALLRLRTPPSTYVCASAYGFYGDRGTAPVDETSPRGEGFLADVAVEWERATEPARAAGIRTLNTRFTLVISGKGGAMGPMLPLFKAGLGGKLGSGWQIWSWVAIDDVVGSILFLLRTPTLEGPVNVVSPQAVTNLAFTRTLGRVLRRPTVLGVPEFVLKTAGGEMAREMLLSSVRVLPRKLQEAGYVFLYPELETAFRHVLAGT